MMEKHFEFDSYFYHPVKGERIIGKVKVKGRDFYNVDIGYSHLAYLDILSFDNSSQKLYPRLEQGELIYGYVEDVPEAGEVIISCKTKPSGETGFGRLPKGTLIKATPEDIARMHKYRFCQLTPSDYSLQMIFGKNGRAWIDGGSAILTTIFAAIINQSMNSENPQETFQNLCNIHLPK